MVKTFCPIAAPAETPRIALPPRPATVTPLRVDRSDLQRLANEIKAVVYQRAGAMSLAEVVGAIEIVKLEIISEQK